MAFNVQDALRLVVEIGGSDLHLKVGSRPLIRLHGRLDPIDGSEKLVPADTERVFAEVVKEERKIRDFERERELDFSFSLGETGRFRVNCFKQRGSVSFVFRAIPSEIKTVEQLKLPLVINDLADEERGIILLTGTTGSGKSTTLAAMINRINTTQAKHVVTIEDPIEFLHRDQRSIINQREVGEDTLSFSHALRRVLRQDPDVILVGEMRDEETVRTALSAAETGHLVMSTVHTIDAPETVNRIIDFFEPHMQNQVRSMLAGTLKGIISQRLVQTADGAGRVAVCEVLKTTSRIKDMIMDPEMTGDIVTAIAEGGYYGMQTFDQALLHHLQEGRITMDEALRNASSPHDFKLQVAAGGQAASGIEQVFTEA